MEPLFLTASDEALLAARPEGRARIARALADGLRNYLSG